MQLGEGSSPQVSLCVCVNPTFSSHISLFFPFSLPRQRLWLSGYSSALKPSHTWHGAAPRTLGGWTGTVLSVGTTRNACGLIGEDGTEWGRGSSVGEKERSPGAEL